MRIAAGTWQPPRLRLGESGTVRHATWLELFSDLVFVVAVAELAHLLVEEVSGGQLAAYAALFVPVWWAWVGQTFYANRFDTDDASSRLLSVAQIGAVAVLAASIHDALDTRSAAFALSYVAIRAVLVVEYVRAGRHVPEARHLAIHYAAGFSAGAALWLLSLLFPPPTRLLIWGVAMVVDIGTPLTSTRHHAALPPQPQHLPERFGLFVVIVLGESIAAVVAGLTEQDLTAATLATAAVGVTLAVALWWMYFENLEESVVLRTRLAGQIWVYTHLGLVVAVAAAGVGVERSILHHSLAPAERWLAGGSVAATLVSLAVLHLCSRRPGRAPVRLVGAALVLVATAVAASWPALVLLSVLAGICAALVGLDLATPSHADVRAWGEEATDAHAP